VDATEVALPAKRVTKVPAGDHPTSSSKPVPDFSESSRQEVMLPPLEKEAASQSLSTQTSTSAPKDNSVPTFRGAESTALGTTSRQDNPSGVLNAPLPAVPHDTEKSEINNEAQIASNPSVIVQAPTPVSPGQDETVLNSPRIRDSVESSKDLTMTEAPDVPSDDVKVYSTVHTSPQSGESALPPPPPPPIAESGKSEPNPPYDPIVGDDVEPKQQWLLPPIQPRFQGKKCLVLDLDETLVHSSFKVSRSLSAVPSEADLLHVDTPPSRLYHSCRD